jgi:hypothetical protein
VDEEFVAGNAHTVPGIKVREMRESVRELMAQARIGEDLPIAVTFAALHECCDESMLASHGEECIAEPPMAGYIWDLSSNQRAKP